METVLRSTTNLSRSTVLALANANCPRCFGLGNDLKIPEDKDPTCACIYRLVFRIVINRYLEIACSSRSASRLYCHSVFGVSRPDEEFLADVECNVRRALADEPLLYRIWRMHVVDNNSPEFIGRAKRLDPQVVRLELAKIAVICGSRFANVEPYPLFPVDNYFREHYTKKGDFKIVPKSKPLRAPVKVVLANQSANQRKRT
jgi:hypothetical protein